MLLSNWLTGIIYILVLILLSGPQWQLGELGKNEAGESGSCGMAPGHLHLRIFGPFETL